jgi:hypothetical protein
VIPAIQRLSRPFVEVGNKMVAEALAFAIRLLNHWCSNPANRQPEGVQTASINTSILIFGA